VSRSIFSRLFADDPHTIALYDGFGANGRVLVQGRVLEDEGIAPSAADHAPWRNALALLRRADADPIPHARVRVTIGGSTQDYDADDEGFFDGWMNAASPQRIDDEWVRVDAELLTPTLAAPLRAAGRALLPSASPERLVISDVDDTVLQSNVTSFLMAVRTMLFHNARTRLPFPGVAAFYQALRRGGAGKATNPTFYVSSSPWNLYDVIKEFLEIQRIPAGSLMLRDVDIGLGVLSSRHHHTHKREMIRRVLSTYPGVPAILIGDSGQQDPEIYRDVVHDYPQRILAVYIRNVTMNDARSRAIQELAAEILAAGSSLVLADDTLAAARHAAEHGWIAPDSLADIAEEKKADEGSTPNKEAAPGDRDATETTPTVVIE
jgi:phosphatidate phosphatase APP1